jgi:hypothetical protein
LKSGPIKQLWANNASTQIRIKVGFAISLTIPFFFRLLRVFYEEAFTAEVPSSQRSENFSIKNSSPVHYPNPASQKKNKRLFTGPSLIAG